MNMGKRINVELIERGWSRSKLYDLVPGLEDGTLSAIIKRDSRSSIFAPAIANALGVELQWLLTGKGEKNLGTQPAGTTLQQVRDTILDDLDVLEPHEAEKWRIRIKAAADERRLDIRAAANKARQQQEEGRTAKKADPPLYEGRRISN